MTRAGGSENKARPIRGAPSTVLAVVGASSPGLQGDSAPSHLRWRHLGPEPPSAATALLPQLQTGASPSGMSKYSAVCRKGSSAGSRQRRLQETWVPRRGGRRFSKARLPEDGPKRPCGQGPEMGSPRFSEHRGADGASGITEFKCTTEQGHTCWWQEGTLFSLMRFSPSSSSASCNSRPVYWP